MRTRLGICSLGLSLAALAAGCGGGRDAIVGRQLAELRAELVRVRADNAVLAERVGSLELSRGRADAPRGRADAPRAGSTGAADARPAAPDEPDRPDLEVVRLAPEPEVAPQADGAARPPALRSTAHGVVLDEPPGGTPPGQPPSTQSRRKR